MGRTARADQAMGVQESADQALADRAVRYLIDTYSTGGNRIGWTMLASILVEAWDLYSISFVLVFIRETFQPSALALGLAAAATQGGALLGALLGGFLSDNFGRRRVFLGTMLLFIVVGVAQAWVGSMMQLIVLRFLLGLPLGSDISNAYTYLMEALPPGRREVMGNRWQFMFAIGEVISIAVIAVLAYAGLDHETLWRVVLGLGSVPALLIFLARLDLPETAVWLVQRGRFREAKAVTRRMYNDPLDILPEVDRIMRRPTLRAFWAHLREDRIRWRATLFGWMASFAQSGEFSTFAFYLPTILLLTGASDAVHTALTTMALYSFAAVSGYVGPLIVPRIGQRLLSVFGFGIVLVSLLVAAWALYEGQTWLVPIAAGCMLWGHYWDAENVMTIPTMVAKPAFRGTSAGVAYVFVKVPAFLSIFLFPALFSRWGQAGSTLFVCLFPLLGLIAALVVLPRNLYGFKEH